MNRRRFLASAAAAGIARPAFARDGYFVPPEEAAHERCFMQWPVSRVVHPDPAFLDLLQDTIAQIANTISEFEPVTMLADAADHGRAKRKLSRRVELWDIPTEDLWCRDSGPVFVVDGQGRRAVRQIQFNGWGGKQVHARDGQIARRVADRLGLPYLTTDLRGEAGGAEQDGHGLLMAHESSWVNDNRNPGQDRDRIERALLDAYGAKRLIWSPGVWGEDITDYHIDSLARFTGPGRVLINLPDQIDPDDPFHIAALETHETLVRAGLEVDVISEPARRRVKSFDFVASYVNYYVCNGGVVAAQFGDRAADAAALAALQRHYPGREIVTLNADALGEVGGGIHCATQQMPA